MDKRGEWAKSRVTWSEHKGKSIIIEDMSGLRDPTDIYAISDTSTALICKQPEASVLLITNVTGTRYNPSVINRLKENTRLTNPYMKAYAVVGIGGLQRVVLQSVVQFTGQDIRVCGSIDEAKEWLVKQ